MFVWISIFEMAETYIELNGSDRPFQTLIYAEKSRF